MKWLLSLAMIFLISLPILSQGDCDPTINGQFVNQQLDLQNMTYYVKAQINITNNDGQSLELNQSKVRFTFNIDGLEFVSGNVLTFINNYENQVYLSSDGQKIWVESELEEGEIGVNVGEDYVDFVEFNFNILDISAFSNICLFSSHIFRATGVSGNLDVGMWLCDEYPLPVEFTSFTGIVVDNKVELNWGTATELNNYGFEVLRNGSQIGFVPGYGNSNSPKTYSFADEPTSSDVYTYQLKQIDNNGSINLSNEISVNVVLNKFELNQNYPNPFNPSTHIGFYLNKTENVQLIVYDYIGRQVAILIESECPEGYNEVIFDASNLASGVYIYSLKTENQMLTKHMTLLK
ncbi:MAG: hypothetical protein JETCAE03_35990 [Ignavibacteriaceae bacterium]|jgi:hypothetical protein|nr:MAG: hypothetical protein JETCAE03_35990 [Ignavibacteriaceae bacterium]